MADNGAKGNSRANPGINRMRLLNGVPVDEMGNPLSPEEQRAYFEQHPRPRPVASDAPYVHEADERMGGSPDVGPQPYAQGFDYQGGGAYRGSFSGAGQVGTSAPEMPSSPGAPIAKGRATAAVVCGILSVFFSSTAVIGITLGIIAIALGVSAARSGAGARATVAKVCGAIGLLISALQFVFVLFTGISVLPSIIEDAITSNTDASPSYSSDEYTYYDYEEQEQIVHAAATARLDELCNMSDEQLAVLGSRLDEDFRSRDGVYSLSDIGMDPTEVARWAASDMSYDLESAYAFPEDRDGSAYATVVTRDYYAVLTEYTEQRNAYLASGGAGEASDADRRARCGQLFRKALDSTTSTSEAFISIEFTLEGDTWVIDEGDWQDEVDYIFWLF